MEWLVCGFQVPPPSVVARMPPESSQTQPFRRSVKWMPYRNPGRTLDDQVVPPLVVRITSPDVPGTPPAAHPCCPSTKQTLWSGFAVPLVWVAQCAPPSTVDRITPADPEIQPWVTSTKETDSRIVPTGLPCGAQVVPPSDVATMSPPSATAHPCRGSANETPLKMALVEPLSWAVQVVPPSDVARMVPFSPTAQPCWSSTKLTPVK